MVRDLRNLLPEASAPPARTKGRYVFDPDSHTWQANSMFRIDG